MIAGLCLYRTAFPIQKFGLKSSAFRPKPFPQISPKSYRHNAVPNRFSSRFSTSRTNGPHSLSFTKVGNTLGFRRRIAHNGSHGETGGVLDGGAVTTLGPFRTFTNIPGPGIRTANFAAFVSWSGGTPEGHREPSEQRCAYACRCPEASRPRWAA